MKEGREERIHWEIWRLKILDYSKENDKCTVHLPQGGRERRVIQFYVNGKQGLWKINK